MPLVVFLFILLASHTLKQMQVGSKKVLGLRPNFLYRLLEQNFFQTLKMEGERILILSLLSQRLLGTILKVKTLLWKNIGNSMKVKYTMKEHHEIFKVGFKLKILEYSSLKSHSLSLGRIDLLSALFQHFALSKSFKPGLDCMLICNFCHSFKHKIYFCIPCLEVILVMAGLQLMSFFTPLKT